MHSGSTVIRSMLVDTGRLSAFDDGWLCWKGRDHRDSTIRLDSKVSVMMAIKDHIGEPWRMVVGDEKGRVKIFSIPNLELIETFTTDDSPIRSLCAAGDSADRLLAGTELGSIYHLGTRVPGRSICLFNVDSAVTSLHRSGDRIHLMTGWSRHVKDWRGENISDSIGGRRRGLAALPI